MHISPLVEQPNKFLFKTFHLAYVNLTSFKTIVLNVGTVDSSYSVVEFSVVLNILYSSFQSYILIS
jgi:hypothetical protein